MLAFYTPGITGLTIGYVATKKSVGDAIRFALGIQLSLSLIFIIINFFVYFSVSMAAITVLFFESLYALMVFFIGVYMMKSPERFEMQKAFETKMTRKGFIFAITNPLNWIAIAILISFFSLSQLSF